MNKSVLTATIKFNKGSERFDQALAAIIKTILIVSSIPFFKLFITTRKFAMICHNFNVIVYN